MLIISSNSNPRMHYWYYIILELYNINIMSIVKYYLILSYQWLLKQWKEFTEKKKKTSSYSITIISMTKRMKIMNSNSIHSFFFPWKLTVGTKRLAGMIIEIQ